MLAEGSTIGVIVTAVFSFLGMVFTGVMTYLMAKLKMGQTEAAVLVKEAKAEVKEVKETLAQSNTETASKLNSIAAVGDMTHALVNSAMLEQQRLLAVTARAKADITQDPVDLAAAETAENAYQEHAAEQRKTTAKGAK